MLKGKGPKGKGKETVKSPAKSGPGTGVSRRDFLRGASVAVSGGVLVGTGAVSSAKAAPAAELVGPGNVPIKLWVNGRKHSLTLEPRVTLLDALRNHLDITGAKKVCDRSTCGACTVLLDGKPVYACSVLAIEAQGSRIRTVEGLMRHGKLHPVQAAFVENDAQQCGFCTPGFVVASKAFLDKNPDPTPEEIRKGLGGNLCRCGTYVGIRKAVADAAKVMKGGPLYA